MSRDPEPEQDLGLHVERTTLAWRRTALAMAVAAAGAAKLTALTLDVAAAVLAALSIVHALAASATSRRRYLEMHGLLRSRGDLDRIRRDGLRTAVTAAGMAVAGLLALAFVVRLRA